MRASLSKEGSLLYTKQLIANTCSCSAEVRIWVYPTAVQYSNSFE